MSFSCVRHPMTMGEHVCGQCGHEFCPECVVFPFGTSKPPICIACALELGGVRRQSTGRPKLTRKSVRTRLALQRKASAVPEPAPEPASEQVVAQRAEEQWMDGALDPDEVPGGWKQTYT